MLNFGKTLVVVAHPDDETLGCGGLVSKLVEQGETVRIIFMAEGPSCRYNHGPTEDMLPEIDYRNQCAIEAMKVFGVDDYNFYNLPCGRLDMEPIIKLAKIIEKEIKQFQPTTILTHSRKDVNNDHKRTFSAVLQATRPVGDIVKNVLSFEILSSSEWNYFEPFSPNVFVDISSTIEKKIEAMHCYSTEQPPPPHPRSDIVIKSQATLRGSQSGVQYAEGFEAVRLFLQ